MTLPVVLASASPRRRYLLRGAGIDPRVITADVLELRRPGEPPEAMARRLARDKAAHVARRCSEPALVLAADTIVVRDDDVLGKPRDAEEAAAMLRSLSGREHAVITGYAILGPHGERVDAVRTAVRFRDLTDAVIAAYVATGEPLDKAGAYGIQGAGARLVRAIDGSYTNVVGLPLVEVLEALADLGGPRR